MYHETFLNQNWDILLLKIVGILVGLALALVDYLHTQSLYLVCGMTPLVFG